MPAPERIFRYQPAVLWSWTGSYDAYGQQQVGAPQQIYVRWNDTQTEAYDAQGAKITLDAQVVLGQKVTIGSRMWPGLLANLPGTGGVPESFWYIVKTYSETKDVKGRAIQRTAGLMRYRDTYPGNP